MVWVDRAASQRCGLMAGARKWTCIGRQEIGDGNQGEEQMTRNSSSGLGSRLRGGQRKEPGSKMENAILRARRGKGTIQALTE